MVNGINVPDVPNKWNLSAMEYEVLRQMRGYKKQAMIAEEYGLSRKTVNTYLARARAKMGVDTMYEAVMTFIKEEGSGQ
jgi:DNA-binding CsgD family transcriptional regulator